MVVHANATTFMQRRGAWRFVASRRAIVLAVTATLLPLPSSAANEDQCLQRTAERYALPVSLLQAIRDVEGGHEGIWRRNTNRSYDYGVMQINSVWLPRLKPLGYDAYMLTHDQCASISVAGWILAQIFAESGEGAVSDAQRYWHAVGRYHSATASLNRRYAERVWRQMQRRSMGEEPRVSGGHDGR